MTTTFTVDLYGITNRSTSAVVTGDYYVGYYDGSSDTPIDGDLLGGFDPNGSDDDETWVSDSAVQRMACYLNGESDTYVFLRLNPQYNPDDESGDKTNQWLKIVNPRIQYTIGTAPSAPWWSLLTLGKTGLSRVEKINHPGANVMGVTTDFQRDPTHGCVCYAVEWVISDVVNDSGSTFLVSDQNQF